MQECYYQNGGVVHHGDSVQNAPGQMVVPARATFTYITQVNAGNGPNQVVFQWFGPSGFGSVQCDAGLLNKA